MTRTFVLGTNVLVTWFRNHTIFYKIGGIFGTSKVESINKSHTMASIYIESDTIKNPETKVGYLAPKHSIYHSYRSFYLYSSMNGETNTSKKYVRRQGILLMEVVINS